MPKVETEKVPDKVTKYWAVNLEARINPTKSGKLYTEPLLQLQKVFGGTVTIFGSSGSQFIVFQVNGQRFTFTRLDGLIVRNYEPGSDPRLFSETEWLSRIQWDSAPSGEWCWSDTEPNVLLHTEMGVVEDAFVYTGLGDAGNFINWVYETTGVEIIVCTFAPERVVLSFKDIPADPETVQHVRFLSGERIVKKMAEDGLVFEGGGQ